jgi:hypothetical protein
MQQVTVTAEPVKTALSCGGTSFPFSSPITCTATVTGTLAGSVPAQGTLVWAVDGKTQSSTLNSSGAASITLTSAQAGMGSHTVTASYAAQGNFGAAATQTATFSVGQAKSSTSLSASQTTISTGQSVTLTATVVGATGGYPISGTVTFYYGTYVVGTASVSGSGVATVTTTPPGTGSYSFTASYGGSTNFASSTSGAVVVNEIAPVTVNLSSLYNIHGIFKNGAATSSPALDLEGNAYSASLFPSSVTWNGITFTFGATNVADAVSQSTIPLPAGNRQSIYLLASAVFGPQTNQTFVINYTDGSSTSFVQTLSDWGLETTGVSNEAVVSTMAYRVLASGATQNGPWHLYGYTFPLNVSKTVKSITLPNDRGVVVFAVGLK